MKVMCIKPESPHDLFFDPDIPQVEIGSIYTVVGVTSAATIIQGRWVYSDRDYYLIAEMQPERFCYHKDCFAPLSNINETTKNLEYESDVHQR
jgi:hypothetical protein